MTVLRRKAKVPRRSLRSWLIGRPLATADAPHQTIGKAVGLAVFASDALSSTAYATQEILLVLAVAGTLAFGYAMPIAIAIVVLLAIVTISYQQTIFAYPNGGGAYIVVRDNLGALPSQVAGAALLTDYVLTVAVSISAGVAQIVSAFPRMDDARVALAILMVGVVTLVNLRGVKESGATFALPTYFFVAAMFTMVAVSIARHLGGTLGQVVDPPALETEHFQLITWFLLLHAFSNGTTALTGVEAISDGIPAFSEPRSRNAAITLLWMAGILGAMFLGITFVAQQIHAIPTHLGETVISQIARTAYDGKTLPYLLTMLATTVILIMAANTAYADFPRLSSWVAADGYLPRVFTYRGSRLVFSRGILALAALASGLIVVFRANTSALIPLYAVGVFMSFTLSQIGMARRWRKIGALAPDEVVQERGSVLRHDPRWRAKMFINSFGAACTFVVMIMFAATKFLDGAWIVILILPLLILAFRAVGRHYRELAARLSLEKFGAPPRVARHRVILPIGGVHRGTLAALQYARTLSDDVTAVHVSSDADDTEKVRRKWDEWGDGVRLVILDSEYRLLVEPLLEYIEEIIAARQPNEAITIVVPQFVPGKWWHNLLHTQTAIILRLSLLFKPGIVITDVPYQVET